MKTRHLDAQTEAQTLKGQVAQLRTEKSALEAKCASLKVATNELTARLGASTQRGASRSLNRAATVSNMDQSEMQSEWTEIIETASSSASNAPIARSRSVSGSSKR